MSRCNQSVFVHPSEYFSTGSISVTVVTFHASDFVYDVLSCSFGVDTNLLIVLDSL